MIKGIENIIDALELERCPYWNIKKGMKDPIMFQDDAQEHVELNMSESMSRLQHVLAMLQPGRYLIEYYDNPLSKNTRKKLDFIIEGNSNVSQQNIAGLQPSVNIKEEIQNALAIEREKWLNELEIKDLRKELALKEAEKKEIDTQLKVAVEENENRWNKVVDKLEPYIGHLITAFVPALKNTPAMAGVGADIHHVQNTDEVDVTERLTPALNLWEQSESIDDIIIFIEKIAALAKEDIKTYNMAKFMLLQPKKETN